MDPFSLTVGVFGILQAVTSCLKLVKKHIGPSSLSSAGVENLNKSLYEFHGAMRSFQMHLELHSDDDERMASLDYLKPAVDRSLESLKIVKQYIDSGRTEKIFRGVKFDQKLKVSLKSLDDASKLFNMAILVDQQTIMLGVKTFVQSVSEDVKDLQNIQLDTQQDNLYCYIRTWLNAQADNDTNSQVHERNLSNRHVGSGEWLLNHGTFQDWLNTREKGVQSKLWLRGPPGSGKSFLCSTAIEHVSNKLQEICLYYFYRFDDQFAAGSGADDPAGRGVRVAAILVHQLFQYFWRQDRRIANHVSAYMKTVAKTKTSLAEATRLILRYGYQYARENGTMSDQQPIILILFLDGLDENKDHHTASEILGLFDSLDEDFPVIQKVWISSRGTYVLKQDLKEWPFIHGDDYAEADVKDFLTKTVPKFDCNTEIGREIEGKPLDNWILEKLQTRAKGNFLYAKLMVEWLKDEVFTVDDIMALITSRVPDKITEMYKRIFLQYQEDQHKYISLLFSLIAFARRPLRLHEIREAMTLALSDPTKGLDRLKVPMRLQRLFTPLIEMQNDPDEPENPLCRLCHSTVQEFLTKNPDVLRGLVPHQGSFTYTISPSRIGDLCLRYLSLERYSRLAHVPPSTCREPLTFSYDDPQQHGLLPYCAKFWIRHLDDLKPTPELRKAFFGFLRSPNFQTLLQAQSLFVTAQFAQFRLMSPIGVSRPMYCRAVPSWFGRDLDSSDLECREEDSKSRRDYRHFVTEWGYLLERSSCIASEEGECPVEHFRGEVDRCLTGLLGPTHFMNHMKERYPSFMLTTSPFEYHKSRQFVIAEAVSASAFQFMIISSPSQGSADVVFDIWDLNVPDAPQLVSTRNIPATIKPKLDAAQSIAFSNEATNFILGNRALDKQGSDNPILLDGPSAVRASQPLSIDFDRRDDIVVIASRNVHPRAREGKSSNNDKAAQTKTNISEDSDVDSSENESDSGSDGSYSSISNDENSAYETYSEGSTDFESDESEDEMSEDDLRVDDESAEPSEEDEDEEESDLESEDSRPEAKLKLPQRDAIVFNYKPSAENKLELEGDLLKQKHQDRPTYPGLPGRFRHPKDRITATVDVYNVGLGQPVRIFHYKHDIPVMLYQSPPVLHPHKALLVWPLGGGDVLFGDYDEKTYFIRAMMPTTRDTRHICMKPRFSPCGGYLHVASIEGRIASTRAAAPTSPFKDSPNKQKIVLSLFLTTHRLSSRKTTSSPPRLIHKVKLTFGQFTGLSLARLPFTFTWTPEHLHFTVSGTRLNVFRISLFRPPASSMAVVTVPRLSVMLPLSASGRQVHYLPPAGGGGGGSVAARGVVLLGSYGACDQRVQLQHQSLRALYLGIGEVLNKELQDYTSPAVGLFVDEGRDLGGWAPFCVDGKDEEEVGVTESGGERFRDGKLTRRIETFSWRDDLDLEGLCDQCNSPLLFMRREIS